MVKNLLNIGKTNRLNDIVNKGLAYYSSNPRHEFNGTQQLNQNYSRDQRLSLIAAIENEIRKIPIKTLDFEGEGDYVLDPDNMNIEQRNLIKYITLELSSKVLRGNISKCKLYLKDLPYINKWNPFVGYILAKEHGLKIEDFIFRVISAKHVLGRDLQELLVTVDQDEAFKINKYNSYYINDFNGMILKEELTTPDDSDREQGTDNKENRINYDNGDNRIIRRYSPWTLTFLDDYTKEYDSIPSEYKLSKEYMYKIVMSGIKNKISTKVPDGEEF